MSKRDYFKDARPWPKMREPLNYLRIFQTDNVLVVVANLCVLLFLKKLKFFVAMAYNGYY